MSEKIFCDTNVVIDFLLDRRPYSIAATQLFLMAEKGQLDIYICAGSYDNLYHIMRNHEVEHDRILFSFRKINRIVFPVIVDKEVVEHAIESEFRDFEDAIQYFSARKVNGIKAIISRDKKGFRKAKLNVLSADEYLKTVRYYG